LIEYVARVALFAAIGIYVEILTSWWNYPTFSIGIEVVTI